MATSTSKIPLSVRKMEMKRAHVDRNRVEIVRIDRSMVPQLTKQQVIMISKVEAEKKKPIARHSTHPFVNALHDEDCSKCRPPETLVQKYGWHHVPWDEIELKEHSLLDQNCQRIADEPILDEVELKKHGLVDSKCHHTPVELDESTKKKAIEIGSRDRRQLDMIKRSKDVLERKNGPHVKILPIVENIDDQQPSAPYSSSSTEMLTARPSNTNASNSQGVSSDKPQTSSSERPKPTMDVTIRGHPEAFAGIEPLVVTKTIETADGQFEFNINFEVRFKPKPKEHVSPPGRKP